MSYSLDFEYLSKIRTAFALNTGKKTSNILEGDYRSVYRGRSMEFDELAAYTPGDNVHDIDWKASSRADEILVRRYVAERKHYVLFITDTGENMLGDTGAGEPKSLLATLTLGTIAYLCDRAGADYACLRSGADGFDLDLFRAGTTHLETMLHRTAREMGSKSTASLEEKLLFASEQIRKKKIIVLLTDFVGLLSLNEALIARVSAQNDLMIINMDDAFLSEANAFDMQLKRYADTFFTPSKKLLAEEKRVRKQILNEASALFRRMGAGFVTIQKEEEITDKVLSLFRRDNLNT